MSNKFGAKRVEVDGYSFASKAEARRYGELKLLEAAGAIRDLWVHPRFELSVNGVRIGWYTADFRYTDNETDAVIVEDVKGGRATKTEAYGLRKKLMRACHGIDITEVAA